MADEQLKQQKIVKNKAIGKNMKNIAHAPIKHDAKNKAKETQKEKIEIKKEKSENKTEITEMKENKTNTVGVKEEVKEEIKTESEKKEEIQKPAQEPAKKETKIKVKKTEAFVYGKNVPISLKHAVAIGKFIKNFGIDEAIANLEKVRKKKMAIPFKGEVAHRKGKRLDGRSMAGGKYPVKASQHIIQLLKTLKANSSVNGLELENTKITEVIPNKASKQLHRFGSTRFKRIHIMIKAKESSLGKTSEKTNKNKEKKK